MRMEVNGLHELGYEEQDIGTHSIHKGAMTLISSLPCGPPTAISIGGGGGGGGGGGQNGTCQVHLTEI